MFLENMYVINNLQTSASLTNPLELVLILTLLLQLLCEVDLSDMD